MPDINMQHFEELRRNQHSIDVEIDASQVVSPQQDFPMMLETPNSSNSMLNVVAMNEFGEQLPTEIEGIANNRNWVHLKDLVHSGWNRKMKMFFGGCGGKPAADSTYGSEAVWDAGYKCVHLMNNLLDSTGNGHTLTAYGSPSIVDTNYGKAYDLNGSTQYFSMADSSDWDFGTGNLTFDVGLDIDVVQAMEMLGFRIVAPNNAPLFRIQDSAGYKIFSYMHNHGTIQFGDTVINTGQTNLAVVRYSDDWMVYLDGNEDDAAWATPGSLNIVATTADVGRYSGNSHYVNGRYKHLKISNVARSSNYMSTIHKNLNNPTAIGASPFYKSISKEHNFVESLQSLGRAG